MLQKTNSAFERVFCALTKSLEGGRKVNADKEWKMISNSLCKNLMCTDQER